MPSNVTPQPTIPRDISLTLNGSAQRLCAVNQYRQHLQFQCPEGSIAYSYTTTAVADPGTPTAGCFVLAGGLTWSPSWGLPQVEIWVRGTNGQILIASEC